METEKLRARISSLSRELNELKKLVWTLETDKVKSEIAWRRLLKDSEEISKSWKGNGAIEEIRKQRKKDD